MTVPQIGGRPLLGPLADELTPDVDLLDIPDDLTASFPPDVITGSLRPWSPHARRVIVEMLRGASLTQAARRCYLNPRTIRDWSIRVPPFAVALAAASEWGNSRIEDEIERRAFGGEADRGSTRMLELLAKSRMPAFREKQQIQIEVLQTATQAAERWVTEDIPVVDSPDVRLLDSTP